MVIITKCPKDLKPMEFRVLTKAMDLFPYQDLYFTTIEYDKLTKMFGYQEDKKTIEKEELKDANVLLVTGIASPKLLLNDMKPHCKSIKTMAFGDHHMFSAKDIDKINDEFAALPSPKIIVTTEKDATRIEAAEGLSEEAKEALYAQPIHIKFMLDQQELFNNKIKSYVHKNSRNSILVKGKNDNKTRNSNNIRNGTRTISFRDN